MLQKAEVAAIALTTSNANVTRGRSTRQASPAYSTNSSPLSVGEVTHWNPRPEPYQYAADKAGLPASSIAMVAVHPWDTHGAGQAGMVEGWINQGRRNSPTFFSTADVEAPTLDGVVQLPLN